MCSHYHQREMSVSEIIRYVVWISTVFTLQYDCTIFVQASCSVAFFFKLKPTGPRLQKKPPQFLSVVSQSKKSSSENPQKFENLQLAVVFYFDIFLPQMWCPILMINIQR
ncbi:unnamed protein product [Eretmochelys imbricata]